MNADPFMAATLQIQAHMLLAVGAFALGTFQLLRPKGTYWHRILGRIWMAMMVAVAVSSFFIPATILRFLGPFGLIHLLSVWTLVSATVAVWAARRGNIRQHKIWALALYGGALIGAGAGAFAPGRIISHMLGYG